MSVRHLCLNPCNVALIRNAFPTGVKTVFVQAHRQLALKAEAAAKAAAQPQPQSPVAEFRAAGKSLELPAPLSSSEEAQVRGVAGVTEAAAMVRSDSGGGGVLDMVGGRANGRSVGGGGGDASKATPGGKAMGLMKEAVGFFSPTSQARHKKLMAAEDERREASLNIMGESSQIIGALKSEVCSYLFVCWCVYLFVYLLVYLLVFEYVMASWRRACCIYVQPL